MWAKTENNREFSLLMVRFGAVLVGLRLFDADQKVGFQVVFTVARIALFVSAAFVQLNDRENDGWAFVHCISAFAYQAIIPDIASWSGLRCNRLITVQKYAIWLSLGMQLLTWRLHEHFPAE